jgi:hypothetical protein
MSMATLVIYLDGFIEQLSDDHAVILRSDRRTLIIDRSHLPSSVQVGDFIVQVDDAGHFRIDQEITEMRRRDQRRLSDGYFG